MLAIDSLTESRSHYLNPECRLIELAALAWQRSGVVNAASDSPSADRFGRVARPAGFGSILPATFTIFVMISGGLWVRNDQHGVYLAPSVAHLMSLGFCRVILGFLNTSSAHPA